MKKAISPSVAHKLPKDLRKILISSETERIV